MSRKAKKTTTPAIEQTANDAPQSRSVIAALYKKTHQMDDLGEGMSLLVRGGNANDPVSPKLFGQLCRANGIAANRWEGKNIGMQFMNLSNVLRNRQKRGEDVFVRLAEPKKRAQKKSRAVEIDDAPALAAE